MKNAYLNRVLDTVKAGDMLTFSIDVTNTGAREGKESVLLYSSDDVASLMPDNRRLRAFEKIELKPGETRRVNLTILADDLAFVGTDGLYHLEEGSFTFLCGGQYANACCTKTTVR